MHLHFSKLSVHFYFFLCSSVFLQQPLFAQKIVPIIEGSQALIFRSDDGSVLGTVITNAGHGEVPGEDIGTGTRFTVPPDQVFFSKDGEPLPVLLVTVTITDREGVEALEINASGFFGASIRMQASLNNGVFFDGEKLPGGKDLQTFFEFADIEIFCGDQPALPGTVIVGGQEPTGRVTFSSNPVLHQVIAPFKAFKLVSGQNETDQDITFDFEVGDNAFKFYVLNEDGSIGVEIIELQVLAGEFFSFVSSYEPLTPATDQSIEQSVEVKVSEDDSISLEIVGTNVQLIQGDPSGINLSNLITGPLAVVVDSNSETDLDVKINFRSESSPEVQTFYAVTLSEEITVDPVVEPDLAHCEQENVYENLFYRSEPLGPDEIGPYYEKLCHFVENLDSQPGFKVSVGSEALNVNVQLTLLELLTEEGIAQVYEPVVHAIQILPIDGGGFVRDVQLNKPINTSLERSDFLDVTPVLEPKPGEPVPEFLALISNYPRAILLTDGVDEVVPDSIHELPSFDILYEEPLKFRKGRFQKIVREDGSIDNGHPIRVFRYKIEPEIQYRSLFLNETGADQEFTFGYFFPETQADSRFLPGDCNQDSVLNMTDAICLLSHLFLGEPNRLPCGDGPIDDPANVAMFDLNGQAGADTSDAIYLLVHLFIGGPGPVQGLDCVAAIGCPDICGP